MPAFLLPLSPNESPTVVGHASESLISWLAPVNDPGVVARIGEETVVSRKTRPDATAWVHTVGQRYRQSHGGWIEGQRYLCLNPSGDPLGVVNVTLHNVDGETAARVSNVFVMPPARRQGLATELLAWAKGDHPALFADSSLSELGALLVGQPIPDQSAELRRPLRPR